MQLTRHTAKLPLARALALVALLCAGALQVQEAGHSHWHELDDSYSQCLVCKSSGGFALPVAELRSQDPGVTPGPLCTPAATLLLAESSPFEARGPPLYS